MPSSRMEAFSDGVIAILITVMVLELKVPDGDTWSALSDSFGTLLPYLLSFVYLGIYWNNHHHLLMLTERIDGLVLWANLHLLFWLSLVPFTTQWLGERFHKVPAATYGIVLFAAAIAFYGLQEAIIRAQGRDSALRAALGRDLKGKISPVIYAVAIALSFASPWPTVALYVAVALMWLVPDRRLERAITGRP